MNICFTGDVFLGGDLLNKSCKDVITSKLFNDAHMRIVNLEQPISDSEFIADKCTLYTGSRAIRQLKELKINAVNLAHNHIQDKGIDGIVETVNHLSKAGIGCFGAGSNLSQAERAYFLTDDIAILGYCEFGKSYLKQIEVAGVNKAGVNPLRFKKIKEDIDALPLGKKVVLYFHWGVEHVWLPPYEDIKLAKKLLEDERVITIIGMHPHRVQGIINHCGKKAYMSVGNFLFPNFYIQPPVQIAYPSKANIQKVKFVTRQYHNVHKLTYKKWRWVNRVSLLVGLCTENSFVSHELVVQQDNNARVDCLKRIINIFMTTWILFLTMVYKLPRPLYKGLFLLHRIEVKNSWRLQIRCFHIRQLGLVNFVEKVIGYVRK